MTSVPPPPAAPAPPLVVAVVVNWNAAAKTAACVTSLERSEGASLRVVIVDNGSTDASVRELRAAFPRVPIVETGRNGGFAAGTNAGLRSVLRSGSTFAWLVNNDAVVEPTALAALLEVMTADPTTAVVGSRLTSPDHETVVEAWGGGYVNRWTGRAHHRRSPAEPADVDYVVGASLLLRLAAVDWSPPLDAGFFLYWEDVDLCFRLRARGWRLAVAESSRVRHRAHGSLAASSPRFDFLYHESAARFFRRHAAVPVVPILSGAVARSLLRLGRGRWRHAAAVWRGTRAGWRKAGAPAHDGR
jgi:GT2 family glycosyltransferase